MHMAGGPHLVMIPLGQKTSSISIVVAVPVPKSSVAEFCPKNASPHNTYRYIACPFTVAFIFAPIPALLLEVPSNFIFNQLLL